MKGIVIKIGQSAANLMGSSETTRENNFIAGPMRGPLSHHYAAPANGNKKLDLYLLSVHRPAHR